MTFSITSSQKPQRPLALGASQERFSAVVGAGLAQMKSGQPHVVKFEKLPALDRLVPDPAPSAALGFPAPFSLWRETKRLVKADKLDALQFYWKPDAWNECLAKASGLANEAGVIAHNAAKNYEGDQKSYQNLLNTQPSHQLGFDTYQTYAQDDLRGRLIHLLARQTSPDLSIAKAEGVIAPLQILETKLKIAHGWGHRALNALISINQATFHINPVLQKFEDYSTEQAWEAIERLKDAKEHPRSINYIIHSMKQLDMTDVLAGRSEALGYVVLDVPARSASLYRGPLSLMAIDWAGLSKSYAFLARYLAPSPDFNSQTTALLAASISTRNAAFDLINLLKKAT